MTDSSAWHSLKFRVGAVDIDGLRNDGRGRSWANKHLVQPRPLAAIDLIHKQPVRWRHERVVSCDGGGGPLGHPRIFINLDKPQICWCTYCGLPFVCPPRSHSAAVHDSNCLINSATNPWQANEHHRTHIESLPSTSYPIAPTGDPAEVPESQRVSDEPLGQR